MNEKNLDITVEYNYYKNLGLDVIATIGKKPVTTVIQGKEEYIKLITQDAAVEWINKNSTNGMGVMMGLSNNSTDFYFALDFDKLKTQMYQKFFVDCLNGNKKHLVTTALQKTPNGFHMLYKFNPQDLDTYFVNNYKYLNYNLDIISQKWYICVYPTPGYYWIIPPQLIQHLNEPDLYFLEKILGVVDLEFAEDYYEEYEKNEQLEFERNLESKRFDSDEDWLAYCHYYSLPPVEFEPDNPFSSDEERAHYGV